MCMCVVMSGERLTHMTKTYNDVEAITRLLQEVGNFAELMISFCMSTSHNSICVHSLS
jgi:hypothetical protein